MERKNVNFTEKEPLFLRHTLYALMKDNYSGVLNGNVGVGEYLLQGVGIMLLGIMLLLFFVITQQIGIMLPFFQKSAA